LKIAITAKQISVRAIAFIIDVVPGYSVQFSEWVEFGAVDNPRQGDSKLLSGPNAAAHTSSCTASAANCEM
jgi:hypothetical protein